MRGTIDQLQNPDGGWPYVPAGPSWTEPTVLALLAQIAVGEERSLSVQHGVRWLEMIQSSDGGWCPQASVPYSTWVGALVALLPENLIAPERRRANLKWMLAQTGQETTPLYRLRQWLVGTTDTPRSTGDGWPWFPGASAWVIPTAFTILALRKQRTHSAKTGVIDASINRRIDQGQSFLLSHACAAGGWNHGGARALGFQANAYAETTGLALLALSGAASAIKDEGIRAAERFLASCRSAEGHAWLTLGLHANGCEPAPISSQDAVPRTTSDLALLVLAGRAQAGADVFGTHS